MWMAEQYFDGYVFKLFTLEKTPWLKLQRLATDGGQKVLGSSNIYISALIENKLTFKARSVKTVGIMWMLVKFHFRLSFMVLTDVVIVDL